MKPAGTYTWHWVLIGLLVVMALPGCHGEDNSVFASATPADLQLRVFAFADGAAFSSLFAGVPVRLTIGDFEGSSSGPFMLDAGGPVALGIMNASCDFYVESSAFKQDAGPQDGDVLHIIPCGVDPHDGRLLAQNAGTGVRSISEPPTSLAHDSLTSCTEFASGQLVVEFQEGTTPAGATDIFGTAVMRQVFDRFFLLRVPNGHELAFIPVLESVSSVKSAGPDCIAYAISPARSPL